MIFDLDEVLAIHELQILEFGGSTGIRGQGLLEAALSRPLQTFDANEVYPSPEEKAAALFESIVINHPWPASARSFSCAHCCSKLKNQNK